MVCATLATLWSASTSVVATASGEMAGVFRGGRCKRGDGRMESSCRYSQVPAFSACDPAMFDVLAVMHARRLAVVSHARSFGYFEGRELSADKPLLFLVGPALHMHPARDRLLRYISPE